MKRATTLKYVSKSNSVINITIFVPTNVEIQW